MKKQHSVNFYLIAFLLVLSSLAYGREEEMAGYMDGTERQKSWPAGTRFVEGYVTDGNDGVVRSGWGYCVRTRSMIPVSEMREECDRIEEIDPVETNPHYRTEHRMIKKTVYFAFDRSNLMPAGRQAIAQIFAQLNAENEMTERLELTHINLSGFADIMGKFDYNLKLSDMRSKSVLNEFYKVNEEMTRAMLNRERLNLIAYGESQASALAQSCMGKATRAERISCLAPERRVEITVSYKLIDRVYISAGNDYQYDLKNLKVYTKFFKWEHALHRLSIDTNDQEMMPSKRFYLRNDGGEALHGLNFQIDAHQEILYVSSTTCGNSIEPGEECFVSVGVSTLSTGQYDSSILIKSFDSGIRRVPVRITINSAPSGD